MVNYTPELKRSKKGESSKPVLVRDIMQKNFVRLKEDLVTSEAAEMLLKNKLTGAPVVSSRGKLVGFLSEKDCLNRVITSKYLNHPSIPISEYMTTELVTVTPEHNLQSVVELFTKNPYQCYPVVENGEVIGLIYRHHCLKAAIETFTPGFA